MLCMRFPGIAAVLSCERLELCNLGAHKDAEPAKEWNPAYVTSTQADATCSNEEPMHFSPAVLYY